MGNQGGRELASDATAFARRPTDTELLILYQLQKKLYTRLVESPEVRFNTSIPTGLPCETLSIDLISSVK